MLRLVIFRLLWRAFGIWPAIVIGRAAVRRGPPGQPGFEPVRGACLSRGKGSASALPDYRAGLGIDGIHAAWNFTQGWLFGAAVSGTGGIAGGPLALRPVDGVPTLLSGGGFGPEASLAALVVSLLASAAFLGWAWQRGDFKAAGE